MFYSNDETGAIFEAKISGAKKGYKQMLIASCKNEVGEDIKLSINDTEIYYLLKKLNACKLGDDPRS